MEINGKRLDDPRRPYIIAEASGNHNQDLQQARLLVQAAAASGADAIKFQTFVAEEICADVPILFGHDPQHDAWCRKLGVTRLRELFMKGGLPRAWHQGLKQEAEDLGLAFLSTPFSVEAARFLVEEVGVQALKIASGDLTFMPLLRYAASAHLPLIVSTGGATLDEIDTASQTCRTVWRQRPGIHPPEDLLFLHCVSVYPCEETWANLGAIATMREYLGNIVGFSDHTLSTTTIPAMAVGLGAVCFEKHLRLHDDTASVDVSHSLDPDQFRVYVDTIRICSQILGRGIKEPHPLEEHDRLFARRDPSDWLRPMMRGRFGDWK